MAIKIINSTIIDNSRNIVNAGVATVTSVSIGNTEVVSTTRQLKNITSLDAVTTQTIGAALTNVNVSSASTLGVTTFTGAVSFGTSAFFGDNDILYFGDGNDLRIYHDGSNSFVQDLGTGGLYLAGSGVISMQSASGESKLVARTDGPVELYHDNIKEFETTGYGATVFGTLESQGLNVSGVSTFVGLATFVTSRHTNILVYNVLEVDNVSWLDGGAEFGPRTSNKGLASIDTSGNINVTGVTTFTNGPVLIGSGTSSGTASQRLQVTGGAYVSGNLGVGITNPAEKVDVIGNYIKVKNNADSAGGVVLDTGNTAAQIAQIFLRDRGTDKFTIRKNASNNFDIFNNATSSASLTIDVAGNVLVGTATSTGTVSQPLQVNNGAYVSGNLGVGATNPQTPLHISGNQGTLLRIDGGSGGTGTRDIVITEFNTAAYGGIIRYDSSQDTFTVGTLDNSVVQYALNIARATGHVGVGYSQLNATIKLAVAGTTLINTNTPTGTASQSLQVSGGGYFSGSVGVGTTNPTSTLTNFGSFATGLTANTLSVTNDADGIVRIGSSIVTSPTGTGRLNLQDRQGTYLSLYYSTALVGRLNAPNGSDIALEVGGSERLRLFSTGQIAIGSTTLTGTSNQALQVTGGVYVNGNIGIANTNPIEKLDVSGNIKLTGAIYGPSELVIDPAAVGDNTGAVRIKGDLYVDGTQTFINSTILELADFNVGIATTVGTNALLDGAGIGIGSTTIRKSITWENSSSSLRSSENWKLPDNKKVLLGDGNDLEIYHNGNDSIISDVSTGALYLTSNGPGVYLSNGYTSNYLARFINGGASELYFNNIKEFETTGYGATVFGTLESQGLNITGVSTFGNTVNVGFNIITNTSSGNGVGIGSYLRLKATTWNSEGGEVAFEYVNGSLGYYLDVNAANTFRFSNYDTTGAFAFVTNSTEKLRITNAGLVGINSSSPAATLDVVGSAKIGTATTYTTIGGDSGRAIEVGIGATDINTYIDLKGSFTYSDYAARLIRDAGDNAAFNIINRGTGPFRITTQEAGPIDFLTNNSFRHRITSDGTFLVGTAASTGTANQIFQVAGISSNAYIGGNLGIGVINPTSKVDVSGNLTVTNPNASGINVRSGATGSYPSFNIGRTAAEGSISVASGAGQFASNAATGDVIIRTESTDAKLILTNGGTNSSVAVAGNNILVGTLSSTGTLSQPFQVSGGAYVSGNLGVGNTNPSFKLDVIGNSIFRGSLELPQNPTTVGYGTTTASPAYYIGQAMGDSDAWKIYGESPNGTNTGTLIFEVNDDIDNTERFSFRTRRTYTGVGGTTLFDLTQNGNVIQYVPLLIGTATSTNSASQPLQVVGNAYISGNLGIGNTLPTSKLVVQGDARFVSSGQGDVTITHSNLVTSIRGASTVQLSLGSNGTDVIRINNSGLVGIGTTNPQEVLDVRGNLRLQNPSSIPEIRFRSPDGSTNQYYIGANISDVVDGGLILGRGANISTGTPRILIAFNGNNGINTTASSATLQIKDALAFETTNTVTTNTNQVAVDTFSRTTFRSAKYHVQLTCPGQISTLGGITTGGRGYTPGTHNVNFTLSSGTGTGAQGTIVVSNGTVGQISVSAGGTGYLTGDVLTAGGGSGLQVSVASTAAITGAITGLTITNAGLGYTGYYNPTTGTGTTSLTLLGGTGFNAVGLATIFDGVITSSSLLQQPTTGTGGTIFYAGSNYTTTSVLSIDRTTLINVITTITGSSGVSTFTTASAHGIGVSDVIRVSSTANGLTAGVNYFVVTTPTPNTFTLGTSVGVGTTFTAGSSLSIGFYRNSAVNGGSVDYTNSISGITTNYQVSELLVLQDGGSIVDLVEYATIANNDILGTFSADISGSNARLLLTPTYSNNSVKVARQAITV